MNIDYKSVKFYNIKQLIKKYGIDISHIESVKTKIRWSEELLVKMVEKHDTMKDILIELDLYVCTSSYDRLKRKLAEYNINFIKEKLKINGKKKI